MCSGGTAAGEEDVQCGGCVSESINRGKKNAEETEPKPQTLDSCETELLYSFPYFDHNNIALI